MNNYFAHQWWENEQKKREDRMNKQEIERLNHFLQKIVLKLRSKIDINNYDHYNNNRVLVQSSIWNLRYINNFENIDVAVLQILLITEILENENIEGVDYLWNELNRAEVTLRNIDFSAYSRMKQNNYFY